MVCVVEQALMESARMGVRAGLDRSLPDDGDGGVVGLEACRLGQRTSDVWDTARLECRLDTDFFRSTGAGLGACGHHRFVGGDFGDDGCVFPYRQSRWVVDGAVCRLGKFRHGVERRDLVGKPITSTTDLSHVARRAREEEQRRNRRLQAGTVGSPPAKRHNLSNLKTSLCYTDF